MQTAGAAFQDAESARGRHPGSPCQPWPDRAACEGPPTAAAAAGAAAQRRPPRRRQPRSADQFLRDGHRLSEGVDDRHARRCEAGPAVGAAGEQHRPRPHGRAATASSTASPITTIRSPISRVRAGSAVRWRTMCSALLPCEGPVRPSTRMKCVGDPVPPHDRHQVLVRRHGQQRLAAPRRPPRRRGARPRPR